MTRCPVAGVSLVAHKIDDVTLRKCMDKSDALGENIIPLHVGRLGSEMSQQGDCRGRAFSFHVSV